MNNANIYTHECMGDHLICYGGVKELAKNYNKVSVRTFKPGTLHFENIKRLYSSIPNVEVISSKEAENWNFNNCIIFGSTQWWFDQVKQWYYNPQLPYTLGENMIFDRFWYNMIKLPLDLKWKNFYLQRDLERENAIFYNMLGLKDGDSYIFIHEDPLNKDEDRTIKRKYIDRKFRLINMTDLPDISILDTTYLIERAKEVHVINSGFLTFIDLMNITHNNLNYHKYARPNPVEQVALRLNWNIINV
jgi:hypothetical protein